MLACLSSLLVAAAAFSGLVTAQEAARFGGVSVSPSVVKPGEVLLGVIFSRQILTIWY